MAHPPTSEVDPYNLRRFIDAQADTFEQALLELADGHKRSHWMWFIFPQVRGLGSSPMAERFAISSLSEATAYLAHPILGPRLRQCTHSVNAMVGHPIGDIFGFPDDLKFYSSVTLFSQVATHSPAGDYSQDHVFSYALEKYFDGTPDRATLAIITNFKG